MSRLAVREPQQDERPIILKDRTAIAGMRRAGALVAETLALLRDRCVPGAMTADLDQFAREFLAAHNAIPSFLDYPGPGGAFPGAICASINDVIVHGIPGARALRDGDIISIDVGAILDGWHGDAAITVPVGTVSDAAARLIADAEAALKAAIGVARAGNRLIDVSATIERYGRKRGYGILAEYTGHGIGREMHEAPTVRNVIVRGEGSGPTLRPGMTFTIEPIFTLGTSEGVELPDGWTTVTADGSLAAHVEHTIAIMPQGPPLVLTQRG
jgi:methionyl aminopeptidase